MHSTTSLKKQIPSSQFLQISAVLCCIASGVPQMATAADSVAQPRPNIVFILADDLGYNDLGCTGSDFYQTPNIDAFAAEGLRFDHAYAAPTCSPSRSAIMSGKNPAKLGIVGHGGIHSMGGKADGVFLVSEEYTLAEALRDGGYTTCHIGKWHVGKRGTTGAKEQGFDEVIASNDFCCPGSYFYPFRDKRKTGKAAEASAVPDLEDRKPGDHLTECLGDEAAKFIARQKGSNKPFFLNLWQYAVHTPIQAQKDKVAKYKQLVKSGSHQKNPSYAALVEGLDDSVGVVLQAIKDNGFEDNTIVIFLSDNGGEIRKGVTSNYPLRSGKTTVYEGGVRVPMFIRWPGVITPGGVCNEAVAEQDIYPTLLDLTGVKGDASHNAEMDGKDISALLKDPSGKIAPRPLVWLRYGELVHYPTYKNDLEFGPSAAILKGGWKMVERYPTPAGLKRKFELFNLKEDPNESKNLAQSHPEKLTDLQRELLQWQKDIKIESYDELAYPAFEKVR